MSDKPFQILLVDDNPDDLKLAEIQLRKINMDLTIDSVGSRDAFQKYLNSEPLPDLVICDYKLPEYTGDKALEFVRDLNDNVPFILITGYLDEESAVELMRKGASDIITKQKLDRLGPAVQRELINYRERKETQQELEINAARYRALVENGSDVLFILNSEGKTTYISPSIKNVLGYTVDEAMSMDMMEKAHPDDIEMMIDEINKCLAQPGVPIKVPPARLKDKVGKYHWFEGTITNMLHDPAIKGIVDNFYEITERVEAEQRTVEVKNKYQSLIQTVDGIVWEAEAETLNFNYVSPQAQKILGYTPEEWMGEKNFWQKRIHPEDRERVISFCTSQTEKAVNHTLEYRMRKADSDYIWLRDVVTVVNEKAKEMTLRGLLIDIDQEKEYKESLKTLNRELVTSNAELEQFAYVVSHDLQEPLRMISSFLAQIEIKYDHLLDEKGKKYIHFAMDGAKRMRQIILDLLEYSRVGRVNTEREDINMNDLVEEAQILNKKLITELKADIKVEKLPVINAAKVPMRQLFQNLINNAIKYHKKDRKPKVKIGADEDEDFWRFEIEDNGIGIEPENTAKIFNIFQRLHGKEEYEGSGIGLAICKKIVENHGGKMDVVSEPGKGSTFSFSIAK